MNNKIAIILSGGGMKCAYTSGALLALQRHYKFITPDIMIAASGSVPAMLYYITEQYRNIEKLWTDVLGNNHKAVSPAHFPMLDIDYLIDKVSKDLLPLDLKKLEESNIEYHIPLRNAETGELEYIGNNNSHDMYEVVRAATAVPIAYGKEIKLGDNRYIDGFYGLSIETLINKAVESGATKIIAINCNPVWSELQTFLETYTFKQRFGLENNNFREKTTEHDGVEIVHINPTRKLQTNLWEVNKKDMVDSFFMGYQNMSSNKEVAEIIDYKKRWLI